MPASRKSEVWVASETVQVQLADGSSEFLYEGITRAREGAAILSEHRGYFKPVDDGVHFDVEQATASPGEKRGSRQGS